MEIFTTTPKMLIHATFFTQRTMTNKSNNCLPNLSTVVIVQPYSAETSISKQEQTYTNLFPIPTKMFLDFHDLQWLPDLGLPLYLIFACSGGPLAADFDAIFYCI